MNTPDDTDYQYLMSDDETDGGELCETSTTYDVPPPPEVEAALRRYLEIQRQQKKLEDERQGLRDVIIQHMKARRTGLWDTKVDDTKVNVKSFSFIEVVYDEALLRERLGERYVEILDLDVKKLKEHLPEVKPLLKSLLPLVGTPSRERIRDVCEQGSMEPGMFKGAFTNTETQRLTVTPSYGNYTRK